MAQAAVEKQIKAAHKFLSGLQALPTCEELKGKLCWKLSSIASDKVVDL